MDFSENQKRIGGLIAVIAALFAIFDYLKNWGVLSTTGHWIQDVGLVLWAYIMSVITHPILFPLLVIVWLALISWLVLTARTVISDGDFVSVIKLSSLFSSDRLDQQELKREIVALKKAVQEVKGGLGSLKETVEKEQKDNDYRLVELEINHHLSKNQVGALSGMIQKLKLDITRGWGVEESLMSIREYIKTSGMPNYYFSDLTEGFKKLPSEYDHLSKEIIKLAQEKLYSPK